MSTVGDCKNCGAALWGAYCGRCGQAADVHIPSLRALLAEALGDLFNFDSRIWRSLSTLALQPGGLTRSYLEGRRVRYTPPFRMYVVTSLVFFVVLSLLRPAPPVDEPPAAAAAVEAPAAPLDAVARREEQDAAASAREGPHVTFGDDGASCDLNDVDQGLSPALRARLEAACANVEADGGRAFRRAFAENIPVTMLVLIPFVAAIMKLLFVFSGRKYVEHLVFFLHVHTFFFLTATVTFLVARSAAAVPFLEWPAALIGYAAWLYFPVYLYMAMRHVYRQGHALTSVKYVALGSSYFVAFLGAMAILFLATLLTR